MWPRSVPEISAEAVPALSNPASRSMFLTAVRFGELVSVGPLNEYRMIARAMSQLKQTGLASAAPVSPWPALRFAAGLVQLAWRPGGAQPVVGTELPTVPSSQTNA